ncbi:MAG: DUF1963 domain-containing protein [Acutalibacteraceae bacterium]|nr:DUF1963 domain-containing protein [Acutalibacteraceae bacterium]
MRYLNDEEVDILIEGIKEKTRQIVYSLEIDKEKTPDIFDSKFGGVPYWVLNKEYPTDNEGNKLIFLAQLNFDKVDVPEPLPQKGILQFFTGVDDVFGLDFDNPTSQNTFRVIYHESVDYNVTTEQIRSLNIPVSTDEDMEYYTPVFKEVAVTMQESENFLAMCDYRIEEVAGEVTKEKFGFDYHDEYDSLYDYLSDDDLEKLNDTIDPLGCRLLGYPFFTQNDPREYNEDLRKYDTLLFQMDTVTDDSEDYVMWGDSGVGNFFIKKEDLKNLNFSDVLYNWDCF